MNLYSMMKKVHQNICGLIAPSTEENRTQVLQEDEEQLTHIAQEDIDDDNSSLITQTSGIHARFESAANKQELPAEEYRKLL